MLDLTISKRMPYKAVDYLGRYLSKTTKVSYVLVKKKKKKVEEEKDRLL